MVDHGADLGTAVVGATTDLTKAILGMTVGGIKQLLLFAMEGRGKVKSGKTNMDKLIKSLDSGDKIVDAKIPKGLVDGSDIAQLAKKHSVTYAVVENSKGEYILYYQESQADRVKNMLEELAKNLVKEGDEKKKEEGKESEKEVNKETEGNDKQEHEDIKENMFQSEQTEILFDPKNKDQFIEMRQSFDQERQTSVVQIYLHKRGEEAQGLTAEETNEVVKSFEDTLNLTAKGIYKPEKLWKQVDAMTKQYETDLKKVEMQEEKDNLAERMVAEKSKIGGSLHIVYDAENPKNRIAVYKNLEIDENGSYATVNKIAISFNGVPYEGANKEDMKQVLESYDSYKYVEKSGKVAEKEFEGLIKGGIFEEKEPAKEPVEMGRGRKKSLAEYEAEVEKLKGTTKISIKKEKEIEKPEKAIQMKGEAR